MPSNETAAKVEAFLRATFGIASDDVDFGWDTHLFNHGYVDSFGAVEIMTFLETECSVEVEPSDFLDHSMNTVNEIADFADRRGRGEI